MTSQSLASLALIISAGLCLFMAGLNFTACRNCTKARHKYNALISKIIERNHK